LARLEFAYGSEAWMIKKGNKKLPHITLTLRVTAIPYGYPHLKNGFYTIA
jgi:hypothetical protein